MSKPRLLDLFCGAGGAAMGYARAGFEVVGVDHKPQPNYPFEFVQADALEFLDLIAPTRELLEQTGLPWVIENVPGAPTRHLIVLCGSMFGLGCVSGDGVKTERKYRQLRRHRNFELSFPMMTSPCRHEGEALGVYGGGPTGRYTFENGAKKDRYGRRGGYQGTIAEKREVMGIDWMSASELNQAIPPAYTELIGHQLMQHVRARSAA